MTFMPDAGGGRLNLTCNDCGRYLGTVDRRCDLTAMWSLLEACGWDGEPVPAGPHSCPRCTRMSRGAARPPRTAGRASPPPGSSSAEIKVLPEAAHVVVRGDLLRGTLAPVREGLRIAVWTDMDIVVDLGAVGVIDSAGLGILVRANSRVRRGRRLLCFAAPSRFVRAVLHATRLNQQVVTFDDCRLARVWLAAQRTVTPPHKRVDA